MLRPGECADLGRRTCSAVIHAVEGQGSAEIDGVSFDWERHDTLAVPPHAPGLLQNGSGTRPAFLFVVDDAPLHRKLRIYREYA